MKNLILFFGILLMAFSSMAQIGNTGAPIADAETDYVCWNTDSDITLTRVRWYVAGQQAPVMTVYHDEAGTVFTPLAADISVGRCAGEAVVSADSIQYDYLLSEFCNIGGFLNGSQLPNTSFYKVIQVSTTPSGATTVTTLENYDTDWNIYTPGSNVIEGFCNRFTYAETPIIRASYTNASSMAAGDLYLSYEICNVGLQIGTITVSANTTELKPGECFSCNSQTDLVDEEITLCPAISWDASNTEFILVTQSRP